MASELKQRIDEAAAHIRARASVRPTIGIVLGTGLGGFASALEGDVVIPYRDIPHFPVSAVESHAGELHLGRFAGREVAVIGIPSEQWGEQPMALCAFSSPAFDMPRASQLFTVCCDWFKARAISACVFRPASASAAS